MARTVAFFVSGLPCFRLAVRHFPQWRSAPRGSGPQADWPPGAGPSRAGGYALEGRDLLIGAFYDGLVERRRGRTNHAPMCTVPRNPQTSRLQKVSFKMMRAIR